VEGEREATEGEAGVRKVLWGGCGLVGLVVVAAIVYPLLARERGSRADSCEARLYQLALGLQMYAEDYDGGLPSAARWRSQLYPYVRDSRAFECLEPDPGTGTGYAMNPRLSGRVISDFTDPASVVAFYDADEFGRPVARHHGGTNCAFLDGHVRWVEGVPGGM
jgi:prepilin-type processing-associated H-X9-DG protein